MHIKSIFDAKFSIYGQIVTGYEFSELLDVLAQQEQPDGVVYTPSCAQLEALPVFNQMRDRKYGGMPIQIGYCNGTNTKLNCLEYHRDSEVNVFESDTVLLVGCQQDIVNGMYDTAKVEAYLAPAKSAVEFYATTLHYAPCDAKKGAGFRAAVLLPRGTNTQKPGIDAGNFEDKLLFARNKWLLALPGTDEAAQGAYVGLCGNNIDIADSI